MALSIPVSILTDTKEIKRIIKVVYEKLYANKQDNVEEMDKFIKTYNLPKLIRNTKSE